MCSRGTSSEHVVYIPRLARTCCKSSRVRAEENHRRTPPPAVAGGSACIDAARLARVSHLFPYWTLGGHGGSGRVSHGPADCKRADEAPRVAWPRKEAGTCRGTALAEIVVDVAESPVERPQKNRAEIPVERRSATPRTRNSSARTRAERSSASPLARGAPMTATCSSGAREC